MASVASAVCRVKRDPGLLLSRAAVEAACAASKHRFRRRTLDPYITILAMLTQIVHGHTSLAHVVRLMGGVFCESALCQARTRLPLEVVTRLLQQMTAAARLVVNEPSTPGLWRGLRTLVIDGTSFSMPDTPALAAFFGYPAHQKPGCGFPLGHAVAVFDAATGLLMDMIVSARTTGELTLAAMLGSQLRAGDLLIGDAQFDTYAHIATLSARGVHGLFRLRNGRSDAKWSKAGKRRRRRRDTHGNLRPEPVVVRQISVNDRIVEWVRTCRKPAWMSKEEHERLPRTTRVRVLRVKVRRDCFRCTQVLLVTTLLDPEKYPAEEIAKLYLQRWSVELNMRYLKRTMGMDVLRSKGVDGVVKELAAFALVYNLVRLVMLEASQRQGVPPDRISFVDALRWLAMAAERGAKPTLKVNPLREGRCEPRARKRRASRAYPLITRPRKELKRYLRQKRRNAI